MQPTATVCSREGEWYQEKLVQTTTWSDSRREPEHNGPSRGYSNDLIVAARVLHAKSACALNTAGRFDLTNSFGRGTFDAKFVEFVMSSGSYRFFAGVFEGWRVVVCFCLCTCLCMGKTLREKSTNQSILKFLRLSWTNKGRIAEILRTLVFKESFSGAFLLQSNLV